MSLAGIPVARGLLVRDRMEPENVYTAAVRPRARYQAHRGRGSACQLRIALDLHLDLHRKVNGRVVRQLVQEHRRLVVRGGIAPGRYARRLGCVRGPDSSRAALQAMLAGRVDGLETDACLTADGRLVLLHDPGLSSSTTLRGWAH